MICLTWVSIVSDFAYLMYWSRSLSMYIILGWMFNVCQTLVCMYLWGAETILYFRIYGTKQRKWYSFDRVSVILVEDQIYTHKKKTIFVIYPLNIKIHKYIYCVYTIHLVSFKSLQKMVDWIQMIHVFLSSNLFLILLGGEIHRRWQRNQM